MPSTLILRLLTNDASQVSWIEAGEHGLADEAVPETGSLEEASFAAVGHRVVCLVPTTEVLLTETTIPTRNRQRILEAVPYALENQLAMDVDTLHFAIELDRPPSDKISVGVVDRSRMTQWLEQITGAGIQLQALLPDVLCLPWEEGRWTALIDGDTALVRTGLHSGFSVDLCNLAQLMRRMLAEAGEAKPRHLNIVNCGHSDFSLDEDALGEAPPTLNFDHCKSDSLAVLADGCSDDIPMNLLQGDFRVVQKYIKHLRPWAPAFALLGFLAVLVIVTHVVEFLHLKKEEQQLHSQIRTVFQETFPDTQRIINPRTQMKQKLVELRQARGRSGDGFIELLGKAASPLANEAGVMIEGISYRDGQLDLRLTLADLQGLEHLKQQLVTQDLNVEIKSASAEGKQVSAHLRITGVES